VREIRTHGSIGREPETDSRQRLNGHEAGNSGHSQVSAYGAPRRFPTLPSPCSTTPALPQEAFRREAWTALGTSTATNQSAGYR
jgi:hypothetical protein